MPKEANWGPRQRTPAGERGGQLTMTALPQEPGLRPGQEDQQDCRVDGPQGLMGLEWAAGWDHPMVAMATRWGQKGVRNRAPDFEVVPHLYKDLPQATPDHRPAW